MSGLLPSAWVDVASLLTLFSLLLAPAAIVCLVIYAVRRPSVAPAAPVATSPPPSVE